MLGEIVAVGLGGEDWARSSIGATARISPMMNKDVNLMKGYLNTGRAERERDGGRDAGTSGDDSQHQPWKKSEGYGIESQPCCESENQEPASPQEWGTPPTSNGPEKPGKPGAPVKIISVCRSQFVSWVFPHR
jgi:hypothetical protein